MAWVKIMDGQYVDPRVVHSVGSALPNKICVYLASGAVMVFTVDLEGTLDEKLEDVMVRLSATMDPKPLVADTDNKLGPHLLEWKERYFGRT